MSRENPSVRDVENSPPSSEHSLFTNAPIGIINTTPEGRLFSANPAMARMFGYDSPEELIESVHDITTQLYADPTDREELMRLLNENGEVINYECRGLRRDGAKIWTSLNVSAVRDENGEIIHFQSFIINITEREQAEEALRESEVKYRNILKSIEDGFFEVDLKGNFTFFNKSMKEILGYTDDELMGLNNKEFMDEETARTVFQTFNKVYQTSIPCKTFDWQLIRKDGTTCWVDTSVSPKKDATGHTIGFCGTVRDVNRRKETEEALRESEERYRTVFENTGAATYIVEPDTTISMVNRKFEEVSGYSRQEVEGRMSWMQFPLQEDLEWIKDYQKTRRKDGGEDVPSGFEFRFIDKNGEIRHGHMTIGLIPNTKKYVASMVEVTERKRAEEALQQSKNYYKAIFKTSGSAIVIIEKDKIISQINSKFEKITGYSSQEVKGRPWTEFVHPDYHEKLMEYPRLLRQNPDFVPFQDEFRFITRHGEWRDLSFTIGLIPETKQTICSGIDITDYKQAEEELRESEMKFRNLSDSTDTGIMLYQDDYWIYANPAAEKISGYTFDELKQMKFWEFVEAEYVNLVKERGKAREKGKPATSGYELKFITKQGKEKWVLLSGNTTELKSGKAGLITVVDITDRKQAEEALRRSENYYRAIFETSGSAMFIIEEDTTLSLVNSNFEKITGYSRQEVEGKKSWTGFVHPDDLERMKESHYLRRQDPDSAPHEYEFRFITRHGEWRNTSFTIDMIPGTNQSVGSGIDITKRKQAEEKLKELVVEDHMTGLYNRRAFQDDIAKKIARSNRNNSKISLLTIDIDNFKRFNDEYSYSVGDGVLIEAAERLQNSVRESDTVYRIGGDEFAILLDPLSKEIDAGEISERIIRWNSMPYIIQDKELDLTFSIGVANYPALSKDKEELINNSDIAAKYAKRNKTRSNYVYFNAKLNEEKRKEKDITRTIDRALEEDHFLLKYQPIFSRNGQIERVETLARIALPEDEGNIISPGEFIPVAEKTGQIKDIDSHILQKACADMDDMASYMYDTYGTDYRLGVSVNISSCDIADEDFVQRNEYILDKISTSPIDVFLEITEQSIIDNPENVIENIEVLKEKGIKFAIDDFGKGYSSLSRLTELPVDELKVDKAYIDNICHNEKHLGVAKFITHLANDLGIESTAEGVETGKQYDVVCSIKCNNLQGFYSEKLSPPLLYNELRDFVTRT